LLIERFIKSRPKEVAFHLPSVDAIARDLVKKIEYEQRSHGIVTDLRLEIGRWSLENAGNMVFDKRLGCLGELFKFLKSFLICYFTIM
jgi:hypothetical protein